LFKDKSGKISTKDFRRLIFEDDSLGSFREETISKYLDELSDNTGWINFEQFKQFMKCSTIGFNNPLVVMELKLAFNEVDTNKDGFISCREAHRGSILAGQYIPGIPFDRIIHKFDDNDDGRLSLDEFLNNINKIISNKD